MRTIWKSKWLMEKQWWCLKRRSSLAQDWTNPGWYGEQGVRLQVRGEVRCSGGHLLCGYCREKVRGRWRRCRCVRSVEERWGSSTSPWAPSAGCLGRRRSRWGVGCTSPGHLRCLPRLPAPPPARLPLTLQRLHDQDHLPLLTRSHNIHNITLIYLNKLISRTKGNNSI